MSHDPERKLGIGDVIVWKNNNTNTVEEGKVHSVVNDTVAIGNHYVSWVRQSDIEVVEYKKYGDTKRKYDI